jgi:hypothetical protein
MMARNNDQTAVNRAQGSSTRRTKRNKAIQPYAETAPIGESGKIN